MAIEPAPVRCACVPHPSAVQLVVLRLSSHAVAFGMRGNASMICLPCSASDSST